jgi:hypothetical protein
VANGLDNFYIFKAMTIRAREAVAADFLWKGLAAKPVGSRWNYDELLAR